MIRGRAEKRTDPAVVAADKQFHADELVHDGLKADKIKARVITIVHGQPPGVYLRDLIARIAREEGMVAA